MKPVYSPKAEDDWDRQAREQLKALLRSAFPGQITKGILPIARSFFKEDNRADFLVGEMGAGKTFMGLAVLISCHNGTNESSFNALVILSKSGSERRRRPSLIAPASISIAKRWIRLIANKLERAKPKGTEIWVMGKERAKLHFQRIPQQITICGVRCCPECGSQLTLQVQKFA